MKFILLVEGYTEQKAVPAFLKRWLDARLTQPVGVKTVRFDGWPQLVQDLKVKTKLHLQSDDVIAVISLLDLYGPTFYPPGVDTPSDREAWGKKHLEDKVGHARFRHSFAVHETEAWLLSQPELFPADVRALFPRKTDTPEQVNFDEPPSYLLNRLYRQANRKTYKKIVYGTQMFAKLDPEVACRKCLRLKALLDELLGLAETAGL